MRKNFALALVLLLALTLALAAVQCGKKAEAAETTMHLVVSKDLPQDTCFTGEPCVHLRAPDDPSAQMRISVILDRACPDHRLITYSVISAGIAMTARQTATVHSLLAKDCFPTETTDRFFRIVGGMNFTPNRIARDTSYVELMETDGQRYVRDEQDSTFWVPVKYYDRLNQLTR